MAEDGYEQTARKIASRLYLERANGIEPSALAWEARVLPLYDAREWIPARNCNRIWLCDKA